MHYVLDITSNSDLEHIYEKYSDLFHLSDIFAWFFRFLGGLLLKGTYIMVSGIENIYNKTFSFIGFVNSSDLNPYIKDFRYIGWGLFTILIAWIGIQYIRGGSLDLSRKFNTILMALVTMVVLPSCITWGLDLVQSSKTYIANTGTQSGQTVDNLAFTPIKMNIIDLKQMDASNFKVDPANLKNKNTLDDSYFRNVWNYTTTIQDDDAAKMKNPTVFQKKLIENTSGGENSVMIDDLSSHIFASFLNEYYYRYSGHIVLIIIELLILGFFFILMALKQMELIIELAFVKIINPLIAMTDDSGARVKTMILSVVGVIASLEVSLMTVPFYSIGMTWLSQTLGSLGLNLIQTAIFFILGEIALFFVMFKGFDLVQKITGIRQGYGSELLQAAIGFGAVGAAANKLGQGAVGAGKSLYNKANPPEQNGGSAQYAQSDIMDKPQNGNLASNNDYDDKLKNQFNQSAQDDPNTQSSSANEQGINSTNGLDSSQSNGTSPSTNGSGTNQDNSNVDNGSNIPNPNNATENTSSSDAPTGSSASTSTNSSAPNSNDSASDNRNNPNLDIPNGSENFNASGANNIGADNGTSTSTGYGSTVDNSSNGTNLNNPNLNGNSNNSTSLNGSQNSINENVGNNQGSSINKDTSTNDTNADNPNVSTSSSSPSTQNISSGVSNGGGTSTGGTQNINVENPTSNGTTTANVDNPNVSDNGGTHNTNISTENISPVNENTSIDNGSNVTDNTDNANSNPNISKSVQEKLERSRKNSSALEKIGKMYYSANVINRATERNDTGEFKE